MKKKIGIVVIIVSVLISLFPSTMALDKELYDLTASKSNVIVVIPGIVGSELIDKDNQKVWFSAGALSKRIECDQLGNPIYPLYAYNDDNYGALDTYETLYTELSTNFGDQADVKFFAYDWRLSNTKAGSNLKALVSGYSGEIILVAHSMGGLVATEYLRIATSNQRSRTTLITLGTPFTGAPKALQVMENGEMFPGIAGALTGSYVQSLIRNFPAAYQLLPTSNSNAFMQIDGKDQTNAQAWDIMETRSWANISENRGIKPMIAAAETFHSNLMQSPSQNYALSAKTSIFVSNIGYSTIQKVNYTLSEGTYKVSSYVSTNSGDGTVPSSSAQNKLPSNNVHTEVLSRYGNHTGMLSNRNTLTTVYGHIGQALYNANFISHTVENNFNSNYTENARGWIIGNDIDGRRIRVIFRGASLPTILDSSGNPCIMINDSLYCDTSITEDSFIGNCWRIDEGYQFELLNGNYTFETNTTKEEYSVEIMYMENGYFDKAIEYSITDSTSISLFLSDYSSKDISCLPKTASYSLIQKEVITPSYIATENELILMNQD